MVDKYEGQQPGLTSPGIDATPIVPNDNQDLTTISRALYVGSAGDVRVQLVNGSEAVFQSMTPGAFYPLRIRRVFATGTTAGGLISVC